MRVNGEWLECDDGESRPILRADVLGGDGTWRAGEFLIDTGADRTVLSANALASAHLEPIDSDRHVGGIGGTVDSVIVRTTLRLTRDDGINLSMRGEYAAFGRFEELEMSILGRDILNMFTLIVDRKSDTVLMIRDRHSYSVQQQGE
jgi:predicted aspartyl protease